MNNFYLGNDSPHAVSIDSDETFVTKIPELSAEVEKFAIDRITCAEFYDAETGEMVLHWDVDTGIISE